MKGQYAIIDLRNMDFIKVMQLMFNHKEADIWGDR